MLHVHIVNLNGYLELQPTELTSINDALLKAA